MSSSDRRTFLLLSVVGLGACGFTPALGPEGSAANLRGLIEVEDPVNVQSFEFVRTLTAQLGPPNAPRYRLEAEIAVIEQAVGILPDQTITSYNVLGKVTYVVTDLATGAVAAAGEVANFTTYSATSTTVATTSAQADARRRLMAILADQVIEDLYVARLDGAA
jgi:LPS-assembly lipoprotein